MSGLMWVLIVAAIAGGVLGDEQICHYPIDLVVVQDTTGSFMDDMPNLRAQMPSIYAAVRERFPKTRLGVVEFRDKPYIPLGEAFDFCYKISPQGALTDDIQMTQYALGLLSPSGGQDLREDHYQATLNTALDPTVGWRAIRDSTDPLSEAIRAEKNKTHSFFSFGVKDYFQKLFAADEEKEDSTTDIFNDPEPFNPDDEVAARVMIVVTDANPHYNGQLALWKPTPSHPEYNVPQDMPPNSARIVNGDVMYSCLHEDYLDPQVWWDTIHTNNMTVIFLYTDEKDNEKIWKWINDDLMGQPAEYRQHIDTMSSNLEQAILDALDKVADETCGDYVPATTEATEEHETDECDDPNNTNPCCQGECGNRGVFLKFKDLPKRVRLEWKG